MRFHRPCVVDRQDVLRAGREGDHKVDLRAQEQIVAGLADRRQKLDVPFDATGMFIQTSNGLDIQGA